MLLWAGDISTVEDTAVTVQGFYRKTRGGGKCSRTSCIFIPNSLRRQQKGLVQGWGGSSVDKVPAADRIETGVQSPQSSSKAGYDCTHLGSHRTDSKMGAGDMGILRSSRVKQPGIVKTQQETLPQSKV